MLIPVETRKYDNNCFIIYTGKKLLSGPVLPNTYYRNCSELHKTNKYLRLGKIKLRQWKS